jgi:outer membrane receptor protein involved in Fe transport
VTRAGGPRLGRALACAGVLALAAPVAVHASDPCVARSSAFASPLQGWPAPLDRPLAFRARDVSLRDALDRLSATARIRISYSAELLPLERRVCVSTDARTVGDALAELLRDTPVEPVVAGADHVVLALRRPVAAGPEPATELSYTVPLERVVVTGSAGGGPQASLPYALDVIEQQRMEREGTAPLSRFLSTGAAGPWGWEQSPSSLLARYGSIRGASSFGVSTPKVFIDGIEVANPLLATQIAPEAVDRIEVIRGPQGAALYGTDAISGVVNIVTRHEGTDNGAPAFRLRTGLGVARSDFGAGGVVAQEHALSLRTGTSLRSAGLDVGIGGVGDYVPQGASRYLLAGANARRVDRRSIVTATARFYSAGAGPAENPLVDAVVDDSLRPATRQSLTQYTLGGSARFTPDARWTHTFIAGLDGDRVAGMGDELAPVPSAAETGAALLSEGGADRATLRWSSVARAYARGGTSLSITLAADHSVLREEIARPAELPAAEPHPARQQPMRQRPAWQQAPASPQATPEPRDTAPAPWVTWTRSTGVVAQGNASLNDRLHLTAGLRLERNGGLPGTARYATLPVLGGAWVTDVGGDATLKLRAAYGKGIRPARTPGRQQAWYGSHAQLRAVGVEPEQQSGIEGGFDLAWGRVAQLQVTAYDQFASGLIQRVALPAETGSGGRRGGGFLLQNVGQISNRGWEVQGSAVLGRLSVDGAFSGVESRVRRLAAGYTGDLRTGDRMLEVPARTLSLTGTWAGDGWSASLTGYRAFDWINYDRLALARDFADAEHGPYEMAGAELRSYWRVYHGVTRLNAAAAVNLPRGLVLVLTGDNLLDHQRGEPDNVTLVPGRMISLGFRAAF